MIVILGCLYFEMTDTHDCSLCTTATERRSSLPALSEDGNPPRKGVGAGRQKAWGGVPGVVGRAGLQCRQSTGPVSAD